MRMKWGIKAAIPVAIVLVAGMFLFFWVSLELDKGHERRIVLLVAAGGAVAICAAMLAALAILVDRPLVELQEKIKRLRDGDLTVKASFAARDDEIGDLGRNFNAMVDQVRETQNEIR
ncbi:MAG: HAMP domain-containing protein, partial [Acidobacteria bacterium]|nr:HAMP domain-containing protein [Acidobacteriota bacterium]